MLQQQITIIINDSDRLQGKMLEYESHELHALRREERNLSKSLLYCEQDSAAFIKQASHWESNEQILKSVEQLK